MDRAELDAIVDRLIAAAGDAEAIAAQVRPYRVSRTLSRYRKAGSTIGRTMRLIEERNGLARRHFQSQRLCGTCGATFLAIRQDARYCSTRCRVRAHRSRQTA
jgi:ribosomal protein S27AE